MSFKPRTKITESGSNPFHVEKNVPVHTTPFFSTIYLNEKSKSALGLDLTPDRSRVPLWPTGVREKQRKWYRDGERSSRKPKRRRAFAFFFFFGRTHTGGSQSTWCCVVPLPPGGGGHCLRGPAAGTAAADL